MTYTNRIRNVIAALVIVPLGSAVASPERVLPLAELSHIHGIVFDPGAPSSLLVATHAGLYRATLEGVASQISDDNHDYMGFAVRSDGTLVSSGHPVGGGNLGFRASGDGGTSWVTLSPGADGPVDFHAIAVPPGKPDLALGLFRGGIQVSDDGGWTWQWSGAAPEQTLDIAVPRADSDVILAATMSGLLSSNDGGQVWNVVRTGPTTMVEADMQGGAYAFVAGEGLLHTQNAGPWETVWRPPQDDLVLLHLAVSPVDPKQLAAITSDGGVILSEDGGSSWRTISQ